MTIIRAMSILQGPSGDPKDRYVNNLHFSTQTGVTVEEAAPLLGSLLDGFYATVDAFVPSTLTREDYRFYDLADEEPRPVTYAAAVSQPTGTATELPFEVAACLSFYGVRNLPRTRGRIFLGPLTQQVMTISTDSGDPQISSTFRDAVVAAAVAMAGSALGGVGDEQVSWGIYSTVDAVFRPALNFWMDNAFDTIRSRGNAATARSTGTIVQ